MTSAMTDDPQELAEASAQAMWANDAASQGLGMKIVDVGPGRAVLSMTIAARMLNGLGSCHGGFVFALADSAFAFACNSHGRHAVAQHCSVTYLAPSRAGDVLTATAREVARVGRSGVYDIRVVNQAGAHVAEFRGHSRSVKGSHLADQS